MKMKPKKTTRKRASKPKAAPRKPKQTTPPTLAELAKAAILNQDETAHISAQLAHDAAADYERCKAFLAEQGGSTYECVTESGVMRREHNEVKEKQDAWRRLLTVLKEFKLTLKEFEGKTAPRTQKKNKPDNKKPDNILALCEAR